MSDNWKLQKEEDSATGAVFLIYTKKDHLSSYEKRRLIDAYLRSHTVPKRGEQIAIYDQ